MVLSAKVWLRDRRDASASRQWSAGYRIFDVDGEEDPMFHRLLGQRRLNGKRGEHANPAPLREPSQDFLLDALAALLLACSVTMVTDFSRRVLGADPDEIGIFAVAVQAAFSVAATGTFTQGGWQWIESLLSRVHIRSNSQSRLRFLFSTIFFATICPIWIWAPGGLAAYYNHLGLSLEDKDAPKALSYLERSIALDPRSSKSQYNLGELLEKSYQYDQAISHYQLSIAVNRQDLRAYSNLSRLLLISGNVATALRITYEAPIKGSYDKEALAAIYAQRGLAEFQLGFSQAAVSDAELSEKSDPNAASYCLLGKIYLSIKDLGNARTAWDQFKRMEGAAEEFQASAPPDCKLRAEELNEKN